MALTSQLRDGVLGQWCADRFPGTEALAASIGRSVRHARPVRPFGQVDRRHWADVGGAFGQRLAFAVEQAPPYYALLGAVAADTASLEWANTASLAFPTHAELGGTEQARRALWWRPSPRGGWLTHAVDDVAAVTGPATDQEPGMTDFVARTCAYLARNAPAGCLGVDPGVEAGLARVCWVLAGWEDCYRGGELSEELAELHYGIVALDAQSLRAVASEQVVAELVELAMLAQRSGTLDRWRALAGNPPPGAPLGYAAPAIVPQWAEADILVGDTLLDVKTVIRLDDRHRVGMWLWQLLGYLWLDTGNRWGIRNVGLYLARHGVQISWNADTFVDALLDGTGRAEAARREFVDLAREVLTAEGADSRWVSTTA